MGLAKGMETSPKKKKDTRSFKKKKRKEILKNSLQ